MKNNFLYNDDFLSLFEKNKEKNNIVLRTKGLNALKNIGFPGHKNEEWKYTNPDNFIKNSYFLTLSINSLNIDNKVVSANKLSKIVTTLVFHDGVYSPNLSTINDLNFKIEINSIEAIDADMGSFINIENESFLALNAALHSDSLDLIFSANQKSEIEIIHLLSGQNAMSNPRINLILEPSSKVEIIENIVDLGEGNESNLYNVMTNAHVSENAVLEIHKVQGHLKSHNHLVDSLKVLLAKNSAAYVSTFSISSGITRNNIYGILKEEGSYFDIKGLSLLDGKEHVDNRTVIEHDAPNCNSNQFYKGVYNGKSVGVFNGKIVVKPLAQKTNSFQSNKTLLMSKEATIYSKPQLEIFADDVKCSHGATSTQPDEASLFYLESRGINPTTAKSLLTYAFANEITESISNEEVKNIISNQIAQKLGLNWL